MVGGFCSSQDIKEQYVSYKDFGFQKQPKNISKIHYKFKDKIVVDQRKESFVFDEFGNIASITDVNFMDGNSEMKTIYEYKNGLMVKECSQFSDKNNMPHCTTYEYNKDNQLIKKSLIGDDSYYETSIYIYKDARLNQINTDVAGDIKLLQELYYNSKGDLYLIKSTETLRNGNKNYSTEAYENGKLLFQRDHDRANTFVYHKEPKMELQFLVKGKKTWAYLELLEDRLTEKNATVANDLALFVFDNFSDPEQIVTQNIKVFKRNENNDIIASGSRDNVKKPMQILDFQKIEYADGTISGSEDFDFFVYKELNQMK